MAQNTARGITYPESTDLVDIAAHMQTLATTGDTAIGVVDTGISSLAGAVPFATAVVTIAVSGSGAAAYQQAFTWPDSRFTVPPISLVTNNGGSGSSAFYVYLLGAPSTSGGTVVAQHRDNTVTALTLLTAHIVGVQMTAGSALG